jgi:flagellar basal body-associated protein FliL
MIARLCLLAALLWSAPAFAADPEDVPQFVKFQPIIFSLVADNRVQGIAQVTVGVQAKTPEDKEKVEAKRPRLRNAFALTLQELGRLYIDPKRPIDARMLRRELQKAANTALPEPAVTVLILDATARKP